MRPTTSVRKSPRKNLPPRNTPDSFCRLLHPTKSSLRCMGGFLFLWETHLENFMSRPDVILTFRQRRCTNRGRNSVRGKRCPHYMSRITSTYFLRLNNSETIVELVGARPLHLLSQTVRSLKSPTGAFVAAQTRACLGRRNRPITPPAKRNRAFPTGNCCTYRYRTWIFQGASGWAHPVFVLPLIF